MIIQYIEREFKPKTLEMIAQANAICEEYNAQGYDLTLRQVYYQFVARGLFENTDRNYKNLGSAINDARLAGLMDWDYITDRTRYLRTSSVWDSPSDIISASARQFARNLWDESEQEYRPEVWVEKDALVGVIGKVCDELRVPYFSCRGYVSQSEMWVAGRRLRNHRLSGAIPVVIHLGDHDPSGLDMTRDIRERLAMFNEGPIEVNRIALNMDQVEEYTPPPNPTKLTDSRSEGYVSEYGYESWELDALEPSVLDELIREAIEPLVDRDTWNRAAAKDAADREMMETISDRWDDLDDNWTAVEELLDDQP